MKHSAFECTKNSEHLSAFSTECSHTLKALGTQCWCDSGHSVLRTSIVCGMGGRDHALFADGDDGEGGEPGDGESTKLFCER